jgi:Protein of unknown function (DUF4238)
MWFSALVSADTIARRHWALMVIEGDEVFYLGDNPVVLQRTFDLKNGKNLGFDVAGVEAFLPLSPKCALYMACPIVGNAIISNYKTAIALHRVARLTILSGSKGGGADLQDAQDVIRRSQRIFRSFTEGEPLVAESANIENLNYLQCSWSLDKLYSNRKDFAFARHVFRKTPQYRDAVKTSLLRKGTIFVPTDSDVG